MSQFPVLHNSSHMQPQSQRTGTLPWHQPVHRDRHGRGIRQPIFGMKLPRYRTQQGIFDNYVAAEFKRLCTRFPKECARCECAVEDVPPSTPLPWEDRTVLLSQGFEPDQGTPMRIVFYRMPIEHRCRDRFEIELFIHMEMVRQFARLIGRNPYDIDPQYEELL